MVGRFDGLCVAMDRAQLPTEVNLIGVLKIAIIAYYLPMLNFKDQCLGVERRTSSFGPTED